MSAPIKKKEENKQESIVTQFNQQNNILVENELNAIGKLNQISPELADRAMTQWEKSLAHRNECDKRVIALEENEQKMREKETSLYYGWTGFGMIAFYVFSLIVFGGGVWLTIEDHPLQGLGAMGFSFIFTLPRIYRELKKS